LPRFKEPVEIVKMSQVAETSEVLTLEEAAAFLRVSEDAVQRLAVQQILPGRQIDGQWRFLRAALADWLRERSGKAVLLGQVGALADDESLAELRAKIYEQRGRPETEDG
jgi:excisionase family DNA binding protein